MDNIKTWQTKKLTSLLKNILAEISIKYEIPYENLITNYVKPLENINEPALTESSSDDKCTNMGIGTNMGIVMNDNKEHIKEINIDKCHGLTKQLTQCTRKRLGDNYYCKTHNDNLKYGSLLKQQNDSEFKGVQEVHGDDNQTYFIKNKIVYSSKDLKNEIGIVDNDGCIELK